MKRFSIVLISFILLLYSAVPCFAAGTGAAVYDGAGLLSAEEKAQTEQALEKLKASYGQDFIIYTVSGHDESEDVEGICDTIYKEGGYGTGDDRSGALLFIDMETRDIYIYAQGEASRYLTDSSVESVLYSYNGGIASDLAAGEYAAALGKYTSSLEDLYSAGAGKDQYNDYYGVYQDYNSGSKRFFAWTWQWIVSFLVAALAGGITVLNVMKQYSMKEEKRSAESFNKAYRATAAFAFGAAGLGAVIATNRKKIPIALHQTPSAGPGRTPASGGSSGGFSGGKSTMHHSSGGGFHSGGGGKF